MLSMSALLRSLSTAVSGEVAWQNVAEISRYHRIQASPGYRAAASYVAAELEAVGLAVRVLSYPANPEASYWSLGGWQEWDCREATLYLIGADGNQELLCDFRACPTSVIQRSASFDGEAEVVLLEDGSDPKHFDGLDVRGKLVLSDGDPAQVYELAVSERGALGILCDRMEAKVPGRSKLDMPDVRRYTSFWWAREHRPCFGFVLTPRQGDRFRRLLRASADGERQAGLRVKAHVDARLYDGAMEVVEARIVGRTQEEVLVVAHLCHPQPSAHDNASGCGAGMEAAGALRRLIDRGALDETTRSVRFLFVPEINGTYAYLADHEGQLANWIAGLNLDMVGGDQRQLDCTFTLERPPEALPSFAPHLLERLREVLFDDITDLGSRGRFPLFRHAVGGFTGGSDHMLFGDPTVGVPMPMLIDWPDRYWHTSADTLDKVDPVMLGKVSVLTAAYAYWLACAGSEEAVWLGHEMASRFQARLCRRAQGALCQGLEGEGTPHVTRAWPGFTREAHFLCDRHVAALHTLQRLAPDVGDVVDRLSLIAKRVLEQEVSRVKATLMRQRRLLYLEDTPSPASEDDADWRQEAAQLIPHRLFRGPLSIRAHLPKLTPDDRLAWRRLVAEAGGGWDTACWMAEYWADGQRTLLEVQELVEVESGHKLGAQLLQCFRYYEKMGLMRLASVR